MWLTKQTMRILMALFPEAMAFEARDLRRAHIERVKGKFRPIRKASRTR